MKKISMDEASEMVDAMVNKMQAECGNLDPLVRDSAVLGMLTGWLKFRLAWDSNEAMIEKVKERSVY